MLDDAADRGLVDGNVAIGARLPGRPGRIDDPWTYLEPAEQVDLLRAQAIPVPDRLLVAIALGTGLREGEQCALRLEDVHAGDDEPNPRLVVRTGIPEVTIRHRLDVGWSFPQAIGKR